MSYSAHTKHRILANFHPIQKVWQWFVAYNHDSIVCDCPHDYSLEPLSTVDWFPVNGAKSRGKKNEEWPQPYWNTSAMLNTEMVNEHLLWHMAPLREWPGRRNPSTDIDTAIITDTHKICALPLGYNIFSLLAFLPHCVLYTRVTCWLNQMLSLINWIASLARWVARLTIVQPVSQSISFSAILYTTTSTTTIQIVWTWSNAYCRLT